MKNRLVIGFIFCLISSLSGQSEEGIQGIVSQLFFDRYYDRNVNLDFQIIDPAAIGMGGAFVAVANNSGAIFQNPAGLTRINRVHGAFNVLLDFDQVNSEAPKNSGLKVISEPKPAFTVPSITTVLPIKFGSRNLVVGLSYSRILNPASKVDDNQYYFGGGRILELKNMTGGTDALAVAAAINPIRQISVGLTYNHLFGAADFDLRVKSPYADKRTYFHFQDREEVSGHFLNFGLMLQPFQWVSFGGNLSPAWQYTVSEKKERILTLNYESEKGWSEVTFVTPADELNQTKINVPLEYSVGSALFLFSRLILACSYENRNWEEAEILYDGASSPNVLSNVTTFRYGLEYRAGQGDVTVPLRLGYYSDNLPQKDRFFEGTYYGDSIKRDFWTAGFGIYGNKILFDFSFRYGSQKIGWWMRSQDYYNNRMFISQDIFNQIMLKLTWQY